MLIKGVRGRVAREFDGGLWLTVHGLPPEVEGTKPMVAVPRALEAEEVTVLWAGDEPGLIAATEPVYRGSLRVRLGEVWEDAAESAAAAAPPPAGPASTLFDQIYLLHVQDRRETV